MKIAIIGYGKMGKEIETIALSRGHEIAIRLDQNNDADFDSDLFKKSNVAIEFTSPESALQNYFKCFEYQVPVVSGTTGWLDHWDEVIEKCKGKKATFFHASNFSLGVNVLFYINERLAQIMNGFGDYDVEIEEIHHIQKLDAPSGTALKLANDIIVNLDRKTTWKLNDSELSSEMKITALRTDNNPGEHTIKYNSNVDTLELKHKAKSRQGFALGAVLAAEFVENRKGVFTMKDLLNF